MKDQTFTIGVVQSSPVFMDLDATIDKACKLLDQAAQKGVHVAIFPEAFIPGYPDWIWQVPSIEMALHQELYALLLSQAVTLDSPYTKRLCEAAEKAGIYVVIGINEKNSDKSSGSINNTLLFINPKGEIFGKHQKLIPTIAERTVWAYGDARTVDTYTTKLCQMGGLICWENYMPLVRTALYEKGIELYAAPTYDEGETWNASMRHIAKEGRCYVASCCMVLKKEDILAKIPKLAPYYEKVGEWVNKGNSLIADPDGKIIAEPLNAEEGILLATANMRALHASKWNLDVVGHYARPDAFELLIHQPPLTHTKS